MLDPYLLFASSSDIIAILTKNSEYSEMSSAMHYNVALI